MEEHKESLKDYVTQDMYKHIKSMNREQMYDFLFNLYKEIYADYEKDLQPDYENIRSEVLKIHGIGNVKADQIIEIIKANTGKTKGGALRTALIFYISSSKSTAFFFCSSIIWT